MELLRLAAAWEENQAVLRQCFGEGRERYFGARWIALAQVPSPRFNHVACIRLPPTQIDPLLIAVTAYYGQRGLRRPALLITPATQPAGLGEALAARGWVWESVPVMSWAGSALSVATPGVQVTEAGAPDLEVVHQRVQRVFFPDATPSYGEVGRRAIWAPVSIGMRHFLARVGGVPVGAGSLFCWGGLAGIYNMCTLPAYRGRGIASAVLTRLMAEALALRMEGIALVPTSAGRPLYERFGFRERFRERYFAPPHTL
jgi:GNAT superfamily N-acetyltransferase